MIDYLHHVPGRLRIRSRVFRYDTISTNTALKKLHAMEGVGSVRHNQKAACVTICYDTGLINSKQIIELLESCKCMKAPTEIVRPVIKKQTNKMSDWRIGKEVGKIVFNILVSRGVTSLLARV